MALAAALLVLASSPSARADVGATIIERCTHGQSLAGFSQQDYQRALEELPTAVAEYTDCGNLIRQAQQASIVQPPARTPVKPTVKVIKVTLSHNALLVTVQLSQKGTVRISGRGLRTTIKKNLAAGRHRIRVPLTRSGVAARKHNRKLIVHVALTVAGAASLRP
jgi:uncharacterized membrane protein YgcG